MRLGKVGIAVKNFGVCDYSRLAVTDWRLRRWRLWFLALMTATRPFRNRPAHHQFQTQDLPTYVSDFLLHHDDERHSTIRS